MYRIDVDGNRIEKVTKNTFSELGFREREHLQEWIASDPSVLGEDLLIIQKEFSGFDDTQERLDLLALDKQGCLVIIENKLDDSGKDVTWQALKYASYCSSLSKDNIRKVYQGYLDKYDPQKVAEENLVKFFDGTPYEDLVLNPGATQRVILIAARFRKEVTSTVLWLLNFSLRLQCFRVTPYSTGGEYFLNVEQILPVQEAEDYMIGMAEKAQDDISAKAGDRTKKILMKEFWGRLLGKLNTKTELYKNVSPNTIQWITASSGLRGVHLNFSTTQRCARAELYIDRGNKDENENIFDSLSSHKKEIEEKFGGRLLWERLDARKCCRIKTEIEGSVLDSDSSDHMIAAMVDAMVRLEKALKPHLMKINDELKGKRG